MKTIVLACLVAVAVAAPQLQEREVVLLRDDRIANEDGTFSYALEADNGINTAVEGAVGSAGQINQAGSYTNSPSESLNVATLSYFQWFRERSGQMINEVTRRPASRNQIVLACLAAVTVAAPQLQEREVLLLRDDRVANEDGTFSYAVEADNGINTAVAGVVGSAGQINQEGSYT
ncbi:uncharacterized protein LOC119593619 [Penaeus monodon]|uniref:uncharacterized protein LOC119593619 n=1 Tax=Penaeus monodon TaxID=6687 RepID=UPI0018A70483|nr:uncharacterized protein LOC119593619 [Penaeus monodon]